MVTLLDGLLDALAKARAGQTVFIPGETENGLGYGVSHGRASSLIEWNRFDWNRHFITGTGRPGCSSVARNNVELGESLSHGFDMHGASTARTAPTSPARTSRFTTTRSACLRQAKRGRQALRSLPW